MMMMTIYDFQLLFTYKQYHLHTQKQTQYGKGEDIGRGERRKNVLYYTRNVPNPNRIDPSA